MLTLFLASGCAMMAHIVLSQVLRILVEWNSPLAMARSAVPNGPLAPDWGFRLLRVKYFLPWVAAPTGMNTKPFLTRLIFWCTRITGILFPLFMLAFFAGAFVVATL